MIPRAAAALLPLTGCLLIDDTWRGPEATLDSGPWDETGWGETGSDQPAGTEPRWDDEQWGAAGWPVAVKAECGDTSGTLTVTLTTDGWGQRGELYLADTRYGTGIDELHTMNLVSRSARRDEWSTFRSSLVTDAAAADRTSTELACTTALGHADPESADFGASFAAALVGGAAGVVMDCVVFGHDPAGLLARAGTGDAPAWLASFPPCRRID